MVYENGQNVQLVGNSTDVFADKASDFIRRSHATPDPFFVMVGTRAPHRPPEVADRHLSSFSSAQLPKPPNFDEADVSDKPAWVRSILGLRKPESMRSKASTANGYARCCQSRIC